VIDVLLSVLRFQLKRLFYFNALSGFVASDYVPEIAPKSRVLDTMRSEIRLLT